MSFDFMAVIQHIIDGFDPSLVFASVKNFMSSNYVLLAVVAMMVMGALNKLIKIAIAGTIIGFIYVMVSTGALDGVFATIGI